MQRHFPMVKFPSTNRIQRNSRRRQESLHNGTTVVPIAVWHILDPTRMRSSLQSVAMKGWWHMWRTKIFQNVRQARTATSSETVVISSSYTTITIVVQVEQAEALTVYRDSFHDKAGQPGIRDIFDGDLYQIFNRRQLNLFQEQVVVVNFLHTVTLTPYRNTDIALPLLLDGCQVTK